MHQPNSLHIETTNRCTLKCPACPRTVWQNLIKQPISKEDLDLDDFEKFLDCESGNKIDTFTLCGDYGDTIYYPDLFKMIKMFRQKSFRIATNGSYKPKQWWEELNRLLSDRDIVILGIDGLADDNKKYRINADWKSINTAINVLTAGPAKVRVQTLVFDFNHNKLNEIKTWAESKGMEWFSLKTSRFGMDKKLIPKDKNQVNTREMYNEEFQNQLPIYIKPRCREACVITSDGYFMPCDWIRNPLTFYKSELFLEKKKWIDRLKIKDITLDDAYDVLQEWMENVKAKGLCGQAEVLCKMKCRA